MLRSVLRDVPLAAAIGACADIACQNFEGTLSCKNQSSFDWRRCMAFASFSGIYLGGVCSALYVQYPRIARWLLRGRHTQTREACVISAIDNVGHVPLLYLPSFFIFPALLRGEDSANAIAALKQEWLASTVSCWALWVPAQFIIFSRVPSMYRVRCVASVNFFWSVTLSFLTNRHHKTENFEGCLESIVN